ncbi:MAG TPA: c-type cytochrome [bacterium]|nr:c-type cytochrome [bacterium]
MTSEISFSHKLGVIVIVTSLTFLGGMVLHTYGQSQVNKAPWYGKEVFREKGCIQCHEVYGEGGSGGPDLGDKKFYGTYLELAADMWNHFPKMFHKMQKTGFEFPSFGEKEMEQLIAYLSFIRYIGEPGSEFTGRKLLRNKECIRCHKFGGEGGDIGPDISAKEEYLSPLALVESMWNHGPEIMEHFQAYDISHPEFTGNEVADLAAAIRSYMAPTILPSGSFDLGNPENGKQLVREKECLRCHTLQGTGGDIGPDFIEMDLNYSVTQIAGKMWNHAPKMWQLMEKEEIEYPTFQRGEMANMISYLYELKLTDEPGTVSAGSTVIQEKRCLSCHLLQGEGGNLSKDLAAIERFDSPLEMSAEMWNHAPTMLEKRMEKEIQWPALTSRDMANLYAYLQSLTPVSEAKK